MRNTAGLVPPGVGGTRCLFVPSGGPLPPQGALQPIEKKLPVGQAGQAVMHRIMQQPLARGAILGHVLQGADDAIDLAIATKHRFDAHAESAEIAVVAGDAHIGRDFAAPQFHQRIERGPEAIPVVRMNPIEPALDRPAQGPTLFAQPRRQFIADCHPVAFDVPIEDEVARAGQSERTALDFAQGPDADLALREGVLHRSKAEQHDDEHQPAADGGLRDIVGHLPRYHQPGVEQPGDQDDPGRDHEHGPVISAQRQQEDQEEARNAEQRQHQTRNGGGNGRLEEGKQEQRQEQRGKPQCQVDEAQVPAVQVEIDEEEPGQGCRDTGLGRGPPGLDAGGRQAKQTPQQSEIDQQIGQHCPGESGGGGEDAAPLDHEHDGQEHRGERRYAQHDAAEQREGVDIVPIGAGLPQIELGQIVAGQFGNHRHGGAGVEGHLEHIRLGIGHPHRPDTGAGRNGGDAILTQIRLEYARTRQPEEWRDKQALDLLIAVVAQRDQGKRRVGAGFAGHHLDAPDDAVGIGRGGKLHAAVLAGHNLDHIGQIDGVDVFGDGNDFKGLGRGKTGQRERKTDRECKQVTHRGQLNPALGFIMAAVWNRKPRQAFSS
jgi:hypothetical protein